MEHCYEITSQSIVAHWWKKYKLPELLKAAEEIQAANGEALDKVNVAIQAFEDMAGEIKKDAKNTEWCEQCGMATDHDTEHHAKRDERGQR
jgi:hypothetical protein